MSSHIYPIKGEMTYRFYTRGGILQALGLSYFFLLVDVPYKLGLFVASNWLL